MHKSEAKAIANQRQAKARLRATMAAERKGSPNGRTVLSVSHDDVTVKSSATGQRTRFHASPQETRTAEKHSRWMIHPESSFKFGWDLLMLLLILYNICNITSHRHT